MDFVMNLPKSERNFDAIFTVIDRFIRLIRFVPCYSNVTAVDAGHLFFKHIGLVSLEHLPTSVQIVILDF